MKKLLALLLFAPLLALAQGIPPNCPDSGGNHLNYTVATHAWSCGTSSGASGGPTAPSTVTTGTTTISNASAAGIRTYLVDTSGGAVTLNLPATPVAGEMIYIKRKTTDGTSLTIGRNAKSIEGAAANISDTNTSLVSYTLQYDSTSGSWWIV